MKKQTRSLQNKRKSDSLQPVDPIRLLLDYGYRDQFFKQENKRRHDLKEQL